MDVGKRPTFATKGSVTCVAGVEVAPTLMFVRTRPPTAHRRISLEKNIVIAALQLCLYEVIVGTGDLLEYKIGFENSAKRQDASHLIAHHFVTCDVKERTPTFRHASVSMTC